MQKEAEDQADIAGAEFKANVFANDPKLYYELFEKEEREEPDVIFPETPEEFNALLNSMKREGVIN